MLVFFGVCILCEEHVPVSAYHGTYGSWGIVMKKSDSSDSLNKLLKLVFCVGKVSLIRLQQIIHLMCAQLALLDEHHCVSFERHHKLSFYGCLVPENFESRESAIDVLTHSSSEV